MPTISFVSPKGGAGKTTSALLLALVLCVAVKVVIIDADPNQFIYDWSKGGHCPKNLTVINGIDEDNIADKIAEAADAAHFVIVDLEGTASKIVVMAVGQSDFVIVPTQGSQLDAKQAARALRVIRQHENAMRRANAAYTLPHSVLLTRTNALIKTRNLKHIATSFLDAGVPVFKTELNEREAFKSLFVYNEPFEHLDPANVPNIPAAQVNAEAYAAEVIETLRAALGSAA